MVTENDGILLPELSEEDRATAESHDGKLFALDLLNPDKLGQFSWINGLGSCATKCRQRHIEMYLYLR